VTQRKSRISYLLTASMTGPVVWFCLIDTNDCDHQAIFLIVA
jgi:hypothetical protein